ncbi:hypothetical protein [Microbacterium sp. No. 7]|uniref:hypothetical protein n=1 Tax=Microbacterium sp. No. 7 TaxID=1714373 RepID=UPI000A7457FB|nr:hypothetical protein [Microbacterium sp. No. 7]
MDTPITASPLTDDTSLLDYVTPLLRRARWRQLWLLFLDENDRPLGPVMPFGDYPRDPDRVVRSDEFGSVTMAQFFAIRFAGMMARSDLAQILMVWERRGDAELAGETLRWARTLRDELVAEGACVRAQLLLHSKGLRVIAPDDLM